MAGISPIATAQIVGLALLAISGALPVYLRDARLSPTLFAELDANIPKPSLSVSATRVEDGWRLDFDTQNWQFTDLCLPLDTPVAHGHAHIYVGDELIGSATMPVFYVSALTGRESQVITVSLRSADHRVLVADGQVFSTKITLSGASNS